MLKITKKALISISMIPLFFAFGVANANIAPHKAGDANTAPLIEKVDQNAVLAKGQNNLPKLKSDKDPDCA